MTRRDNDTRPDFQGGARDTQVDPHPPGARETRDGGDEDSLSAPLPGSPRHRSEPEPMDAILRRLGRSKVQVPNSLEPGVARQAVHAPVAPYRPAPRDRGVFVEEPIEAPPPKPGERQVGTVARQPKDAPMSRRNLALGAALAAFVLLFGLAARWLGTRGEETVAPVAAASATDSSAPSDVSATAASPTGPLPIAAPPRSAPGPSEAPDVTPEPARASARPVAPREPPHSKVAEPKPVDDDLKSYTP